MLGEDTKSKLSSDVPRIQGNDEKGIWEKGGKKIL